MNLKSIYSYLTTNKTIRNVFNIETYTITYEYYVIDENNNSSILQEPVTVQSYAGQTITLTGDHELASDNSYHLEFEIEGQNYNNNDEYIMPSRNIVIKQKYYKKTYTVKFDSNGGIGTMNDQKFVYGVSQNLNSNSFSKENRTFKEWNTKLDGTGTKYQNEESVINLTDVHRGEIILYAQWLDSTPTITYVYGENFYFNGTEFINTGLYPFSTENLDYDFEFDVGIVNTTFLSGQNQNYNTVFDCTDHSKAPWTGFLFRGILKDGVFTHAFKRNSNSPINPRTERLIMSQVKYIMFI